MGYQERKDLITKIEKEIDARLLVFVTGDRQGMETRIAPDVVPLVSEHLTSIGSTQRLGIFLYTPGGDSIAAWGLASLARQYCEKLVVLVPFRALSCATLIAMGADELVMGRHGFLSPVDPSVSSPFNPPAPGPPQLGPMALLTVSVEDMVGFLDLARKEVELKTEESMVKVLGLLAEKVHPLALGAVYRAREQTSTLARNLLRSHMTDEARMDRIVARLTQELPTHNYLIGRTEASEEIELDITEPPNDLDSLMWELYRQYQDWFQLTSPASSEQDLGEEQRKRVRYERAVIESLSGEQLLRHVYTTEKELIRMTVTPPGTQMPVDQTVERVIFQGWVAAKDGEVVA